jgi:uncharacterized membrane protein SpoIIM required for sporulation
MLRKFWGHFTGKDLHGRYTSSIQWYRDTVALLRGLRQPLLMTAIGFVGAVALGFLLARQFAFPPSVQAALRGVDQLDNLSRLEGVLGSLPLMIMRHNVRVIVIASILGVFTFGVLGFAIFMLPWAAISFIAAQIGLAGDSAATFVAATILPHATVELPALFIVTAAALKWQTSVIAPRADRSVSQGWLEAAADYARIAVGVVVPLLLIAALLEAHVTPLVVRAVYGG